MSAAVLSLKTSMTSTIRPTVTRIPGFHSSYRGPTSAAVRPPDLDLLVEAKSPLLDGAEHRDRDGHLEDARHLEALAAADREAPAGLDVDGRDAHDRPARLTGGGVDGGGEGRRSRVGRIGNGATKARGRREPDEKRTFNGTPPKRRFS